VPAPFGQAPANARPLQQQLRRHGRRNVQRVMRISKRSFGRDLEGVAGCPPALLYKLPKTRASASVSLNSNRSLPTFEPVSVRGREFRREKVRRGQRLGRHFWRRWPIPSGRDRTIPRLPRQSRGKSKTIPTVPGNRSCAGLRGGAGRTRNLCQAIMRRYTKPRVDTTTPHGQFMVTILGGLAQFALSPHSLIFVQVCLNARFIASIG
jgi:hypothetical protein